MASSYLQLVNFVLQRLNEVTLTSSNFSSARDISQFVKDIVNDSIQDVLNAEVAWPFMQATGTQILVAGTREYTLPANTATVDWDSFYIDHTSATMTAQKLTYMDYNLYRNVFLANDIETDNGGSSAWSKPTSVYRTFDGKFGVTTTPNDIYKVKWLYYTTNTPLSAASDVSVIPDRYEHLIKDRAAWYAYIFREDAVMSGVMNKKFTDGLIIMRKELINYQKSMETGQINIVSAGVTSTSVSDGGLVPG